MDHKNVAKSHGPLVPEVPIGQKRRPETWFLALNGAHRWDFILFECYDRKDLPKPDSMFGCYMYRGELNSVVQEALNLLTNSQVNEVVGVMNGCNTSDAAVIPR